MKRILIVEDESSLRDILTLNLELEGYEVASAPSGSDALAVFNQAHFDLVILDVMLPGMSGMEVCAAIRILNDPTPILMLTARNAPEDRVEGLRTGADDYLTKPFNLEELLLRVANLLRRTVPSFQVQTEQTQTFRFGDNWINFQSFEASSPQGPVMLTKKETALLRLLVERPNEVVSRQQILQIVWGYDIYPSTRTIDNFILNFRKYFEKDPKYPKYFHSIRGVGYRFTP
ncbi:MAG: response regulator transcription factor [Saprospiraceae bacterium]|nr:response regulator transcription factor [Saprospiraceae bacterium]